MPYIALCPTSQAMVYDLLDIQQDTYTYHQQSLAGERERKVILNGGFSVCIATYIRTYLHTVCIIILLLLHINCTYVRTYIYLCTYVCIHIRICMNILCMCAYHIRIQCEWEAPNDVTSRWTIGKFPCFHLPLLCVLPCDITLTDMLVIYPMPHTYVHSVLYLIVSVYSLSTACTFAEEDPIWESLRHAPINEAAQLVLTVWCIRTSVQSMSVHVIVNTYVCMYLFIFLIWFCRTCLVYMYASYVCTCVQYVHVSCIRTYTYVDKCGFQCCSTYVYTYVPTYVLRTVVLGCSMHGLFS